MKFFRILAGILVLIIIIAVIIWIFLPGKNTLSQKEEATALKTLLGRNPHLASDVVPTTWDVHTSSFVQFRYPSWAKLYPADDNKTIKNGSTLDSFSFNLLDDHVYAVIQVVKFEGILSEYPAVALRLSQKNIYTSSSSDSAQMDSIHFAKEQDMVERSAFFLKSGKVVSIAVTGYADTKVEDMLERILLSLKIF